MGTGTSGAGEGREPFLGILLLDGNMAKIPGAIATPLSFPYPVVHRTVKGATGPGSQEAAMAMEADYVAAAKQLEAEGAIAITENCNGRMIHLQRAMSNAVNVPVAMSPLLWVPTLHRLMPDKRIGILTFFAPDLGEWHYQECGWSENDIPITVEGIGECESWLEFLRTKELTPEREAAMAADLIGAAQKILDAHDDVGAFICECTLLPPCSQAVRNELRLPVYDGLTLLDFLMGGRLRPAGY